MNGVKKKAGVQLYFTALIMVALAGVLVLVNAGCMNNRSLSVDYGTSNMHSVEEMDLAVAAVKADFAQMEGCKLYSLRYAGDERCRQELEYANKERAQEDRYTDCIVFDSVFRSPVAGGGAWEPNELYRWSWLLAKKGNGAWIVISKGYA